MGFATPSTVAGMTFCLLLVALVSGGSPSLSPGVLDDVDQETLLPSRAEWEILWDDVVDDSLNVRPKKARILISVVSLKLNGHFIGDVYGTTRRAIFTGEVVPSEETPLVLIQQREPGYTCVYQLQRMPTGILRGVWHDTRARSGDVAFRQVMRRRAL